MQRLQFCDVRDAKRFSNVDLSSLNFRIDADYSCLRLLRTGYRRRRKVHRCTPSQGETERWHQTLKNRILLENLLRG